MRIYYEKQPQKILARMPKKIATAIWEKVAIFATNPRGGHLDVKKMKGMENVYRLRHGNWRVLMVIRQNELIVTKIGSRGDVYK